MTTSFLLKTASTRRAHLTLLGAFALLSAPNVFAAGLEQSPINITAANTTYSVLPPLIFSYGASINLDVINTGSPNEEATIRGVVPTGSKVTVSGIDYDLLQFHFHAEAEHEINGYRAPMEAHFVHKAADGTLLVVGSFVEIGAANANLSAIFDDLPPDTGSPRSLTGFNLGALLPSDLSSFRYNGSLTTDPFTEGVKWNVLANSVLTISEHQFDAFEALFDGPEGNSRGVQELNRRIVLTDVVGFAAAVPEPSTYAFMLTGLAGLGVFARRRRAA